MLSTARGGLIERVELTSRITSALDRGSVLLIAGAGYGKTTALRQALRRSGALVAWVRCGDAVGDGGRLLGLVLDAVCAAAPGAADALAEQLASMRAPIDPEQAAASLERELASVLLEPLVVAFDDAEAVASAPAALDVLARLLSSESPRLRVAVATRTRLTVRLARQMASGRLVELGPSELAFSASECAEYLLAMTGRNPDPGDVETLLTTTVGWPLGVALAVSADAGATGPSPSLARDYFAEEVFGRLDTSLQEVLLAASIAPDLEIAERAGLAPADGFAAAIERHGLLVRSFDHRGRTELHPLFREFLRSRFAAECPPSAQQAAARELARALTEEGRDSEAIDYHLAARDWPAAAKSIARAGPALVRSAPESVISWISALPAGHAQRPELQLLRGELAHGQGHFEDAVELCRAAVQGLDAAGAAASRRFAARFALADVLMGMGDLAGAGALADALELPEARGDLAARAVGVVAAAALARQGRFDDARAVLDRALDDPCARLLAGLAPAFAGYYLELPAGRLDDALEHARQAVATLELADPTGRLPYAMTYLMAIHEERGEDSDAIEAAERTRRWAHRLGISGWVGAALSIRSGSLRARAGDVAGAEADLAEVPAGWRVWGVWELETTRAVIAARRGDGQAARAAAERAVREVDAHWPYFDRLRCAALLAPILSSCGHPGRAREIVEKTLDRRPPGFCTSRLHAVRAWLLHDEGDEAGSLNALAAACSEAGDQLRHVVRREWPRIERPLWVALERRAIDIDTTIGVLLNAQPGGAALASFTQHPDPAVRRAALLAAAAAGHPAGIDRISELVRDPEPSVAAAARRAGQLLVRNPPPLSFRVLGGFEVRRGTWLVDDGAWERRVAQRVVRLLLCRAGGAAQEDELIDAFWPEAPLESARRSVQVAVSAARAVLDPPGARDSRIVSSERTYRLRLLPSDSVDALQFERAAAAALTADPGRRRGALLSAAALWGGEPLPEERYAEWATTWRERLIDLYGAVLSALSDAHEQAGDRDAAVDAARRLVELDPLNESAHRRLIVAFARAGRRGHALRQFLACRRILVGELGVEPEQETAALQQRVLAGEPV